MRSTFFTFALFSWFPFSVLAGKQDQGISSRRRSHQAQSLRTRNNKVTYKLQDFYQGQSFLDDWDFFSTPDPTHGNVNYLTKEDAISKKLAFVQSDNTTVLAVDDTSDVPVGGERNSVRISTKKVYNGGLFIMDAWSMPHGCSVWPAYWSVGPNWPNAGEIDILEGVHNQPTNQYTLHTSSGCTLSTKNAKVTSKISNTQCATSGSDNTGCAFIDTDTRTYGHGFNTIAGGVFAHLWNNDGIKIWHFPRTAIPEDIAAQKPNPSGWGTPAAFWSSASCDMGSHFFQHSLVLDTTICGDLGGPTYSSSGCPGTCAQAVSQASNFKFAKWQMNYIAVYQPS